ncbi:TPA: hypothetical protein ACH3X2_000286 [Trebouxia sp. C0005]
MCGLTVAAQAELTREMTRIIHCAGSLNLHLHIHEVLQQAYFPLKGWSIWRKACHTCKLFALCPQHM